MKDRILNVVQATTKAVTTVGTGVGVFSIELLLLEKALPLPRRCSSNGSD